MTTLEQLSQAVAAGKSKDAKALTQRALDEGAKPGDLVDRALVSAMAAVGEKFKNNEIFVPEMLIAARAMKEAMNVLEPRLLAAGITPKYTAVIGTVQGDLHDIGKNLVAVMWKGANLRVIDLGTNVSPAKFASAIKEHRPQVVGLSALLTTTMPAMIEMVRAIRTSGCPSTKIMVGGAPVSRQFADENGADGYAPDAASAAKRRRFSPTPFEANAHGPADISRLGGRRRADADRHPPGASRPPGRGHDPARRPTSGRRDRRGRGTLPYSPAVPLMDLTLEKTALLLACGLPAAEIDGYHFARPPAAMAEIPLTPRMQASCEALANVAGRPGLVPIGPFSLMTKLVADPITPVYLAGSGVTAAEDREAALVEQLLAAGERVIHRFLLAQIEAGAISSVRGPIKTKGRGLAS